MDSKNEEEMDQEVQILRPIQTKSTSQMTRMDWTLISQLNCRTNDLLILIRPNKLQLQQPQEL